MRRYKIRYEIPGCIFPFYETVDMLDALTEEDAENWCRGRGAIYIDFQEVT